MESQGPPLKERWDPLQGGVTWRGFGLAPRLPGREGLGAQRVPSAPGMPVGWQPGWWQHPRATAWGSSLGRARDAGLEGLRSGQQRLGGAGSDGGWGELGMHVHACACVSMCVHVCACMALPFPQSLLWGREGMRMGEGLGMLNRDEAFGWFLPRRAGLVWASERHPCSEPGWPPAPQNTPCTEPEQQTCSPLQAQPWVVPPSCTHCRPHVPPGGRVPPSLAIFFPFQLNALSFVF